MKPHDIFSLALRLVGLMFLYQALSTVPAAFANFCPVFPHFNFRTLIPSIFLVGWPLAVGLYLIKGAPRLMRLAYPGQCNPAADHPGN